MHTRARTAHIIIYLLQSMHGTGGWRHCGIEKEKGEGGREADRVSIAERSRALSGMSHILCVTTRALGIRHAISNKEKAS